MKKEPNKSRSIQSELLRMAEGFADGSIKSPSKSSNEWNLVGVGDGIEDWEFTNEAIKSLLREHYSNKGNPFTQVKIDSRDQLGDYLREMDYAIVHTRHGHRFQKGISNHFGDFPEGNRQVVHSSNSSRHSVIRNSGILLHSQAEGVFLGAALFMEESIIHEFLGIPSGETPILLPSHRRSFEGIQVEIDSMLMWVNGGHTYMAIFEVKGTSRKTPDWSGGYSYHQVKNMAMVVAGRLDQNASYNTTIIPVYFRNEWTNNSDKWTARLDRFDPLDGISSTPEIISSLDILHLPR